MRVGSDAVDAGTPIDISAILTWEGVAPAATIWGSAGGPVSFSVAQIDGDIKVMAAMDAACAPHGYTRLAPAAIPFVKSGGYSADDPNAGFYRAYFADPLLRLPEGNWRVTANVSGYLKECEIGGPEVSINLEAELLVR